MTTELPFISVMIPVRNEARFIANTLQQLYDQDYPKDRYEILIGDGQSDDDTVMLVNQFAEAHSDLAIQVLNNPKRLSSAARNLMAQAAQGDYVLLIDGHVHIPTDQLIRSYGELAARNEAKVLGRPQPLDPPDISDFQYTLAKARSSKLAHSAESMIYAEYAGWTSPISIGVMYHRSLFQRVGYFDEDFDAAEDLEFNYRLEKDGLQCYTAPELSVSYYPRESIYGLFNQMLRYGSGRTRFIRKHPERFTIETYIPAGFVLFLLSMPVALLAHRWTMWLWISVAAIYVLALLAETIRITFTTKPTGQRRLQPIWIPAVIVAVHVGLGWGSIAGYFKKDKEQALSPAPRMEFASKSSHASHLRGEMQNIGSDKQQAD